MGNKNPDYYQLKADLIEVQYEEATGKIVLVFYKTSDPKLSVEKLRELKGFVVVSVKKPLKSNVGQTAMP